MRAPAVVGLTLTVALVLGVVAGLSLGSSIGAGADDPQATAPATSLTVSSPARHEDPKPQLKPTPIATRR